MANGNPLLRLLLGRNYQQALGRRRGRAARPDRSGPWATPWPALDPRTHRDGAMPYHGPAPGRPGAPTVPAPPSTANGGYEPDTPGLRPRSAWPAVASASTSASASDSSATQRVNGSAITGLTRPGTPQRHGRSIAGRPGQYARQARPGERTLDTDTAWEILTASPREPWGAVVRRWMLLGLFGVVVLVGVVSILRTAVSIIHPSTAPTGPLVAVADAAVTGYAEAAATDYLSWDSSDKTDRRTALGQLTRPDTAIDGWDGTGKQWADSAHAVQLTRSGTFAVVTVRVRVQPFTPTSGTASSAQSSTPSLAPTSAPPSSSVAPDAGASVASGSDPGDQGWTPEQARWIDVAVPLNTAGGTLVLTAPPAPIGSGQTVVTQPVLADQSEGDDAFATATNATVTTLMSAYGTGQLAYARAAGTTFTGLGGTAKLDHVQSWRVAPLATRQSSTTRTGDVVVTWSLTGGAGKITAEYVITLTQQDQRWYLASVNVATKAVDQ